MASIATDFDLVPCGISLRVDRRLFDYTFSGDPSALRDAASGVRRLRLSPYCFEPILPRPMAPAPNQPLSGELRNESLRHSVDRQMRRITKYVKRGYTWDGEM